MSSDVIKITGWDKQKRIFFVNEPLFLTLSEELYTYAQKYLETGDKVYRNRIIREISDIHSFKKKANGNYRLFRKIFHYYEYPILLAYAYQFKKILDISDVAEAKEFHKYYKTLLQHNENDIALPSVFNVEDELLKEHQKLGIEKALYMYQHRDIGYRGMFLADTQGAGKTYQALGFIRELLMKDKTSVPDIPLFLIVVPANTRPQWQEQVMRFLDINEEHVLVKDYNNFISDTMLYKLKTRNITYNSEHKEPYIIITSYAGLEDIVKLGLSYDVVIFDESHYLKNYTSKRYKNAISIPYRFAFLMTGTPTVNEPVDLYTQLSFIVPEMIGKYIEHDFVIPRSRNPKYPLKTMIYFGYQDFKFRYGKYRFRKPRNVRREIAEFVRIKEDTIPELRMLIKPFFLRRNVDDILPSVKRQFKNLKIDDDILLEYLRIQQQLAKAISANNYHLIQQEKEHITAILQEIGARKAIAIKYDIKEHLRKSIIQTLHKLFDGQFAWQNKAVYFTMFHNTSDILQKEITDIWQNELSYIEETIDIINVILYTALVHSGYISYFTKHLQQENTIPFSENTMFDNIVQTSSNENMPSWITFLQYVGLQLAILDILTEHTTNNQINNNFPLLQSYANVKEKIYHLLSLMFVDMAYQYHFSGKLGRHIMPLINKYRQIIKDYLNQQITHNKINIQQLTNDLIFLYENMLSQYEQLQKTVNNTEIQLIPMVINQWHGEPIFEEITDHQKQTKKKTKRKKRSNALFTPAQEAEQIVLHLNEIQYQLVNDINTSLLSSLLQTVNKIETYSAYTQQVLSKMPSEIKQLLTTKKIHRIIATNIAFAKLINSTLSYGVPILDGRVTPKKRHQIVKYIEQGFVPMVIAGIKASGVGINLSTVSNAYFVELAFTVADNEQAEARIKRLDSTHNIAHVIYYIIKHSYDDRLLYILWKKSHMTANILGEDKSLFNHPLKNSVADIPVSKLEKVLMSTAKVASETIRTNILDDYLDTLFDEILNNDIDNTPLFTSKQSTNEETNITNKPNVFDSVTEIADVPETENDIIDVDKAIDELFKTLGIDSLFEKNTVEKEKQNNVAKHLK